MLSCFSRKVEKNQEMVWKRVLHYFEFQNVKSAFKNWPILQSTPNISIQITTQAEWTQRLSLRKSEALPRAVLQWWIGKSRNSKWNDSKNTKFDNKIDFQNYRNHAIHRWTLVRTPGVRRSIASHPGGFRMFVRVVRMWFTRISILFKRRTLKCHRWFINLIKTRRTNKRNYGFRKQSQKNIDFPTIRGHWKSIISNATRSTISFRLIPPTWSR